MDRLEKRSPVIRVKAEETSTHGLRWSRVEFDDRVVRASVAIIPGDA